MSKSKLNKDGLSPGESVDFYTLQKIKSEQRKRGAYEKPEKPKGKDSGKSKENGTNNEPSSSSDIPSAAK